MRLRAPASAVVAASSVGLALAGALLAFALAGSQPALVAAAMVATAAVLGATLLFGRVAGTVASLGALAGWATVAVASADSVEPGLSVALGVTVYLSADTALDSLARRTPMPASQLAHTPWAPRLLVAGLAGGLAYLVLRGLEETPAVSPGLAFAAVTLTLVTLAALVAVATVRRRDPTGARPRPSGS